MSTGVWKGCWAQRVQNVWRIQRLGLRLRQDRAVHSEPLLCVLQGFFLIFFLLVRWLWMPLGWLRRVCVCVWACVSGVTVATCVWMDSLVAELKAFTCAFCCSLLMAPGLTLSCPLPLLVIAVVSLCPTEPLVDLWQEQRDVNRLFFFFF